MEKYEKIKWILIAITAVMLVATIISFALLLTGNISPEVNRLIVALNTLSAQVLIAYTVWYRRKKHALNGPTYQLPVQVVGTRKAELSPSNPLGIPEDSSCFAAFRFPNGGIAEMNVPVQLCFSLKAEQHGILTYQHKNGQFFFVNFRATSS